MKHIKLYENFVNEELFLFNNKKKDNDEISISKKINKEIEDLVQFSKKSKNYNKFLDLLSNIDNIKSIKESNNKYYGGYDIIFNTGDIINFNNKDLYDQGGSCIRIIIKPSNEELYLDYNDNKDLFISIRKFYEKTWGEEIDEELDLSKFKFKRIEDEAHYKGIYPKRKFKEITEPKDPIKRKLSDEETAFMYRNFPNNSWSKIDALGRIILGGSESSFNGGMYYITEDDLNAFMEEEKAHE